MTVSHGGSASGARYVIGQAINDLIDVGTAGNLVFKTAADAAVVATLPLVDPAATSINSTTGLITFDCTPALEDASPVGGTIARALIESSTGVPVLLCDVAESGSDINMSSLVVAVSDTVQVTALSYTPPT